jgi:hypothetical protein
MKRKILVLVCLIVCAGRIAEAQELAANVQQKLESKSVDASKLSQLREALKLLMQNNVMVKNDAGDNLELNPNVLEQFRADKRVDAVSSVDSARCM